MEPQLDEDSASNAFDKSQLATFVFAVVDDLNENEFQDKPLEKALETPLFGRDGRLDSLDLVNFVMAVEDQTEDETGQRISLADDRAMSQEQSPFRTIGSLVDYMAVLISER